jgi:hypothetical protein
MRQLGTFRLPCGAGRVKDHSRVLRLALDHLSVRHHGREGLLKLLRGDHEAFRASLGGALRGLVGELCEGENPPRAGVSQVEGDLSRLQQRIHRYNHSAGPQHPVVDRRKRRHVRQHDRDPIARL